jgi:FkbM family methyltransferase
MKRIDKIKNMEFNSSFARKVLKWIYVENRLYRIPFGDLRGLQLRYTRSINFHAMLGFWEMRNFNFLSRIINAKTIFDPAMVICDVGANLGLYSMWFSRIMPQSKIYSFEPSPEIRARCEENIEVNHLKNIQVFEFALTDKVGEIDFFIGSHHHTSSIHEKWAGGVEKKQAQKIKVPSTTLDDFFYVNKRPLPKLLKMDIEGGGTVALKGCDRCFQENRPYMIIESHTPDEDRAIGNLCMRHNYKAYRIDKEEWVTDYSQVHPNPKGVWGNLFLYPTEMHTTFTNLLKP